MRIFSSLDDIKKAGLKFPHLAVALGMFDGVHIGHQTVIAQAVKLAKEHGGTSAVFTFSNHPLTILAPDKKPLYINDEPAKIRDIEALGVDLLFNIEFTKQLSAMSPDDFMAMLRDYLSPEFVVTGPNYSFGSMGKGTPELLAEKGSQYGFKAYMHHFVYCRNSMVSSTAIRRALIDGDLDRANQMLGKPFSIDEEVSHGKKRGRLLGFPTANLMLSDDRAMVPNGVYIVAAYVDGRRYNAIASVGTNPTFRDISRRVEVNIFDFAHDIYGKVIRIDFLKAIRREIKFTSVDALLIQIKKDVQTAKDYFAAQK